MSTMLKTSLVLNLFLLTCLGALLTRKTPSSAESLPLTSPAASVETQTVSIPVAPDPSPALAPPPALFRWSQVESSDYRVYIANLRSIGCPEQTIHDIIAADLHGLYAARLSELDRRRFASILSERLALEQQIKALQAEEATLLASLLVAPSLEDKSPFPASEPDRPSRLVQHKPVEIAMPLVFQAADTTELKLSQSQLQAMNNLRQSFVESVGGLNQDPNDPAYLASWQTNQPAADEQLRAILGLRGYQNFELSARLKSQPAVEN